MPTDTVLHIVGNRPQFIKLAVLYKELSGHVPQKVIHTGQHSSAGMSGIFFSELSIPPVDLQLEIKEGFTREDFIDSTSASIEKYLNTNTNQLVFVYGDTNTTLAAAIAAQKTGLPLFHFEAGVRTGDAQMPEELNRRSTDQLALTNYCCTQKNYAAMQQEGHGSHNRLRLSGDLMYDAFLKIAPAGKNPVAIQKYVAVTIHRAANILSRQNLTRIVEALNQLHLEIPVVMPVHPHTKKRMEEYKLAPAFILLEPLGYPAMKTLLADCSYVITDSGGAAREAFFSQKKSVVVMEYPFWPEIIDAGCSIASAADTAQLYESFYKLPGLKADFHLPIFGKGDAARFIKEDLIAYLA